jgi:hypothetical protein
MIWYEEPGFAEGLKILCPLIYILGAGPIPGRKRHHSTWLETDLDSLVTLDHGLDSPASPQHQTSPPGSKIQPAAPSVDSISQAPLYVNTDASSMRIGNYPSPRIIADTRGYVRYIRDPHREIYKSRIKRHAPTSDSCHYEKATFFRG